MTRPSRVAARLVGALVLLGACSGDDGRGVTGSTTTSAAVEPTAASTTTTGAAGAGETTSAPPATTRPSAAAPPEVRTERVAELDQPLALVPHPRTGVLYVADKGGRVLRRSGSGWDTLLDIGEDVSTGGERGLLGLAIHPTGDYAYVDYTDREGDTRVVEYRLDASGSLDRGSRRDVLVQDQPYANHNGGHLLFGPDGFLYVGFGDGGNQGDPHDNGQNLGTLLGKILRIDPRPAGSAAYGIPPGNPFVGRADARPEVWAYGLRNPWRFSFDRATAELWIGDVGGNEREEIDRAPASSTGGENYGWDVMEGTVRRGASAPPGHVAPVHEYATGAGGCAVTGGYVYRGSRIPGLHGFYVFGDYCRGELLALRPEAPGRAIPLDVRVPSLAGFGEDADGELYALSLQGDVVRLVPA